jgi:hypothetical protein
LKEKLKQFKGWTYAPYKVEGTPKNVFVKILDGAVEYGKPKNYPSYGWDNEYGQMKVSF